PSTQQKFDLFNKACLNNNPTQTLKIRNASHYSSARWANAGK
ncbi:TPA: hypothetical protein ACRR48_005189, partial [Klebsiella quasipneumoniae]